MQIVPLWPGHDQALLQAPHPVLYTAPYKIEEPDMHVLAALTQMPAHRYKRICDKLIGQSA